MRPILDNAPAEPDPGDRERPDGAARPVSAASAYASLPLFVLMILGVGSARFILTVVGVEDELTRYASMTSVIMVGVIWFGSIPTGWRQRLRIAYGLILPYMLVETVGLGYTWLSGKETIFHAPAYAMGTSLEVHLIGHVAGGVSWEPLTVFALMTVLAWIFRLTRPR